MPTAEGHLFDLAPFHFKPVMAPFLPGCLRDERRLVLQRRHRVWFSVWDERGRPSNSETVPVWLISKQAKAAPTGSDGGWTVGLHRPERRKRPRGQIEGPDIARRRPQHGPHDLSYFRIMGRAGLSLTAQLEVRSGRLRASAGDR